MPERLFSYCVLLVISFLCEKMFGNSSLCGQNEKYFFKKWKMFSLWERWRIGDQKSRLAMGNHHEPASSQLPFLFEKWAYGSCFNWRQQREVMKRKLSSMFVYVWIIWYFKNEVLYQQFQFYTEPKCMHPWTGCVCYSITIAKSPKLKWKAPNAHCIS